MLKLRSSFGCSSIFTEGHMKKHTQLIVASLALILAFLLSACGNTPGIAVVTGTPEPTSAPTITITPDPCAPENREAEVLKIHEFMREFDDAATLARVQQGQQLANAIAELQRIRREAEDQPIPPCMGNLKTYQISHMNLVINTLIAMMGGSEQAVIDQGIALARDMHDQYLIELARVLGLTIEAATIVPLPNETAGPPTAETPGP